MKRLKQKEKVILSVLQEGNVLRVVEKMYLPLLLCVRLTTVFTAFAPKASYKD